MIQHCKLLININITILHECVLSMLRDPKREKK